LAHPGGWLGGVCGLHFPPENRRLRGVAVPFSSVSPLCHLLRFLPSFVSISPSFPVFPRFSLSLFLCFLSLRLYLFLFSTLSFLRGFSRHVRRVCVVSVVSFSVSVGCTCQREMRERHTTASVATVHVSKQQKTNGSVAVSAGYRYVVCFCDNRSHSWQSSGISFSSSTPFEDPRVLKDP